MTANPDTGNFLTSTDELLRTRMVSTLGSEATDRFFEAIAEVSLVKRAKAIARQAKVLEALFPDGDLHTPAFENKLPAEQHVAAVVDIATPLRRDDAPHEAHRDEPLASEASVEVSHRLPVEQEQAVHLHEVGEKQIEDDAPLTERVARYIDTITGAQSTAHLELRASDKEAVTAALLAMNHPLDARMRPEIDAAIFGYFYEGLPDRQITERLAIDRGITMKVPSVSQRIVGLKRRAIKMTEKNGTYPAAILKEHVRRARGGEDFLEEETHINVPMVASTPDTPASADVVQAVGSEPDHEVVSDKQEMGDNAADEAQTTHMRAEIIELVERITGQETAESLTMLLSSRDFIDDMAPGQDVLRELMARYASTPELSRQNFSDAHQKAVYRVALRLADLDQRRQGLKSITLPRILQFDALADEGSVLRYVRALVDRAAHDDTYKPMQLASVQHISSPLVAEVPVQQHVSERHAALPDLWKIALQQEKTSDDVWGMAFDQLFEDAVHSRTFTRTQAVEVKARMVGDDKSRDITAEVRSALNKLQQLAAQPETNLDQDPEAKAIFNMFTMTVLGVNTIDDIKEKLERRNKKPIREKLVVRKLAGATAHVLQGGNK